MYGGIHDIKTIVEDTGLQNLDMDIGATYGELIVDMIKKFDVEVTNVKFLNRYRGNMNSRNFIKYKTLNPKDIINGTL